MSVAEEFLIRIFCSVRVVVEHSLCGIKGCRIVKAVLRLRRVGLSDRVMAIACGLHNLRVSSRHLLPAFDLLNLVGSG